MTQLIVGDPGCTFLEIMTMFDDPSLNKLKLTLWSSLAARLDIPLHYIKKWQQDLLLEKFTHVDVVILELLKHWRMEKSDDATLGALYKAIPDDMPQVKDFVQAKIRKEAKDWNDLDEDSQNVVMQTTIRFLGRKYSLETLQCMMSNDKFNEIFYKAEMKEWFMKSFKNDEWDLGQCAIPKTLPYYIRRKLQLRRKLNPAIFKHECSDIFLIEGVQSNHLSILARPQLTDVSSNQLVNVTRRFILLEHEDDYVEITKVASHSVHKIKHENNQFFWMSTAGSTKIIRIFLLSDVEEIDEKILIKDYLSKFNNRPIAICSSPGMGKSVLLSSLAQEIMKTYPQRISIYLELRLFVLNLTSAHAELDSNCINQILVSSLPLTITGKQILLEFLHNQNLVFEIFLDGFDEILFDFRQQAKRILKGILSSPNKRVYITSRPHMQTEIEEPLEVISLNISPFSQENQVNFLLNYWTLYQEITNHDQLPQFVSKVLESIEFMNEKNSSQTDFTGIPLQCFILAQIYSNDAKMYCNRENFQFKAITSLYKLYSEFVTLKFKNIEECDKASIKIYHWKEALQLMFPYNQEVVEIINELNRKAGPEEVPWDKIFTVGIFGQAPDNAIFLHRTFAEYLLAEFIVEELLLSHLVDLNISVKFIIEAVLSVHETTKGQALSLEDVSDICLIKSSESWSTAELSLKKLKTVLISQCNMPVESVHDELYNILYKWVIQMGSNATIDKLYNALEFVGCGQLIDDIHEKLFHGNSVLQNEMLCTFVEAVLKNYGTIFVAKKLEYCENMSVCYTEEWEKLKLKLLVCTEHGYMQFTQTLVGFYHNTFIFEILLNTEPEICKDLLIRASHSDNVEFFKYICETIEYFTEFSCTDFLKLFINNDLIFQNMPICEPASRGNYKLVEYLINNFGENVEKIDYMWLACSTNNWKDSPNVIANKVKILRLLRTLQNNFQIEILEKNFLNGVNLVLLTTLYDLCDFVPTETDVDFVVDSILNCCRNDSELDFLADWFLSKKLGHLFTHSDQLGNCMLNQSILKNVMSPETLKKIYKIFKFDFGIIFDSAVLCKRSELIVKTIIELSGDINMIDDGSNTLLHWAAFCRKLNVVNYLLSKGANVNYKTTNGNTALHEVFLETDTAESFHTINEIVSQLVASQIDVNVRNISGLSARDLATAHQDVLSIEEETLVLLENSALGVPSLEVFKILMDEYKFMNFPACFKAYLCQNVFAWTWNIVQVSGNVNLSNSYRITLLHEAALFGQFKTMKYLLLNGADPNSKDNDGDTPFHYIFDWSWRNNCKTDISLNEDIAWIPECVKLLLKHNADVSVKNKNGETPLDRAQQQKENLKIKDSTISILVERFELENEID